MKDTQLVKVMAKNLEDLKTKKERYRRIEMDRKSKDI